MTIAPVDAPAAATSRAELRRLLAEYDVGLWTDQQVVALLRYIARPDLPARPAEAIIHFTVARPAFSAADLDRLCRHALRWGNY